MSALSITLLQYRQLLRTRQSEGLAMIWSPVRRRWLHLTPEEMVRQLAICHLQHLGYSTRRIQEEKQLLFNGMPRRYDLVVYHTDAQPVMLVECKAPMVPVSQKAFDQAAIYNCSLMVPYLWITNGKSNFCCEVDHVNKTYTFLSELPLPPTR